MDISNQITSDTNSRSCTRPLTFYAGKTEGICALLSFIPAYLYISYSGNPFYLAIIAGFLIFAAELFNKGKKRSTESFVWLSCFILCTVSRMFCLDSVWNRGQTFLFIHIFAVWWILSRSGKLIEGESGHMLPADAINGFIIIPFSYFTLRIKSIIFNIKSIIPKRGKENVKTHLIWIIPAILCLGLFILSANLLTQADRVFHRYFKNFFELFRFEVSPLTVIYFVLSLPVGAWLFGLVGGSSRYPEDKLDKQRESINVFLQRIRGVSSGFWAAVVGIFTVLYLAFFIIQGSYLFGAFTHTLPGGFIVSRYAREGFFELCKVMAVNFTVLWLVTRMASKEASESRLLKIICLVFLGESILFAVVAFSKICLYISCYGFTPKRLQSAWLVTVLTAGCILWAYTLLTDKPVFKKWMYFGAISLTALAMF